MKKDQTETTSTQVVGEEDDMTLEEIQVSASLRSFSLPTLLTNQLSQAANNDKSAMDSIDDDIVDKKVEIKERTNEQKAAKEAVTLVR